METSPTIRVQRHPGIPSPTAVQVLRSGVRGFDADAGFITGISWFECFEGPPRGGNSPGKGWYFSCEDGDVFLPDPRQKLFKPVKNEVLGFAMESAVPTFDWLEFDNHAEELASTAVVMPFVDWLSEQGFEVKTLWRKTSHRFVQVQHQNGNERVYTIKADKEWFGPMSSFMTSNFDRRWDKEFEVLSAQVVEEALGGDAYLEGLKQRLREKGLRVVPVEPQLNFESFTRRAIYTPRLFDGPAETMESIEEDVTDRLAEAGYSQVRAMAALYMWENASSLNIPGLMATVASTEVLKDPKFAAALLERWRPSLDSWRANFEPLAGTSLEFNGPAFIERCARGDYPST